MNKFICICTTLICLTNGCFSQNKDIKFSAKYILNSKHDTCIKIELLNISKKTKYYCIGVSALVDTGFVGLTANIDALGKIDFLALKALKPNAKIVKYISKSNIIELYNYLLIEKLKFFLILYESDDFHSKRDIINLNPI